MSDKNRGWPIDTWTLLSWLGAVASACLISSMVFIRWEWSFLMDDIAYLQSIPKVTSIPTALIDQIHDYLRDGRFYPVKYLANLLKWRYLPLQPALFHWINLIVLATALLIGGLAILRRVNVSRPRAALVFVVGLAVLQRPLLDVIALNSIGESWLILFFALGLLLFPHRAIAYRLAFLLAGLSKEPAVLAFGAAGFAHLLGSAYSTDKKRRKWGQGLLDMSLCLIFVFILKKIQSQGTYLADYSVINENTARFFSIGLVKCLLGLLPLVALVRVNHQIPWKKQVVSNDGALILCTVFGLGYLLLATARGVAGYLLIPAAFSFYLAACFFVLPMIDHLEIRPLRGLVIALSFIGMLVISLGRYERYCASINESTRAFEDLLLTHTPRLVILNGEEAVALGQLLADQAGTPVKVEMYRTDPETSQQIKAYRGDVILFELSTYFGRYSPATLQALGVAAGGWKYIIDRKVCRIFYGQKPPI